MNEAKTCEHEFDAHDTPCAYCGKTAGELGIPREPEAAPNAGNIAGSISANGCAASLRTIEAMMKTIESIHRTMCFTPHFARHHLEQDHAAVVDASNELEKLRQHNEKLSEPGAKT